MGDGTPVGTGSVRIHFSEVYGTLRVGQLVPELLPHIFAKAELPNGDGGVGTIWQLTFAPGIPGLESYTEKLTKVDNENYIKEAESIGGDILKLGFLYYMVRCEIIGKGPTSSVIRSTVEYEINDGHPELEAMVSTAILAAIAEALVGYIKVEKMAQSTS